MILHLNPFNAECRAFGRLKEMGCEDAAVRVYGYVDIDMTEAVEQKIRDAMPGCFDDPRSAHFIESVDVMLCRVGPDWNAGLPTMAIVKDWVEAAPDFRTDMIAQGKSFRRILQNLHKLHRCGIVVRDISDAQFVNGVLVDLSHARTTPHVFGPDSGIRPAWEWASMAAYDLYSLQEMIDWWNGTEWSWIPGDAPAPKKCTLRAYGDPERVVLDRLRPRARLECQRPYLRMMDLHDYEYLQMTHPPRYDPAAFDWRKAVERKKKRGAQAKPSPSSAVRVQSRVRLGRKRGHASTGKTRKAAGVKQEDGVRVEEE